MFHRTDENSVERILKEDFKNSEEGWFGQGVYKTDCSSVAQDYGFSEGYDEDYVFVKEIFNLENPQVKKQTFKRHYNKNGT